MIIKIRKLTPTARLPVYATEKSAGMDVFADLPAPVTILPGERKTIPTGIAAEPETGECAVFAFARSGLGAKHGITLSNGVGVIDADYRGEIRICLINLSQQPYTVAPGERIAQLAALPVLRCDITETAELSETVRGDGGFGSSGKL